jgi:ribosomal protein L11 methyltransferase
MKWVEITVATAPQAVEAIANILLECRSGGVSEELLRPGVIRLRGYLPVGPATEVTLAAIDQRIRALPQFGLSITPGTVDTAIIEDTDWASAWKTHYRPFRVGQHFWIKPTWEDVSPPAGAVVIELDPGMAFGSGLHASTQLCLRVLEDVLAKGATVFDVGTGSGILAIAAAKLGVASVLAIDADPVAVAVARENVAYNKVADRVQVHVGDLLTGVMSQANLIVANLTADIHFQLLPHAAEALVEEGVLVASGIIADRVLEVHAVATASGFEVLETRQEAEWRCLVLRRAAGTTPQSRAQS